MSGPIVRKYGFPNFEKIFGDREIKHGADETASTPQAEEKSSKPEPPTDPGKADPGPSKP